MILRSLYFQLCHSRVCSWKKPHWRLWHVLNFATVAFSLNDIESLCFYMEYICLTDYLNLLGIMKASWHEQTFNITVSFVKITNSPRMAFHYRFFCCWSEWAVVLGKQASFRWFETSRHSYEVPVMVKPWYLFHFLMMQQKSGIRYQQSGTVYSRKTWSANSESFMLNWFRVWWNIGKT